MSASGPTSEDDSFSQFNCLNFQERLNCEKGAWNGVLCVKFQHDFFPSNPRATDCANAALSAAVIYWNSFFYRFLTFFSSFLSLSIERFKFEKDFFLSMHFERRQTGLHNQHLSSLYGSFCTVFQIIFHFLPLFQQARHHNYIFASQHFNCEWKVSLENFSAWWW